MTSHSVNTPHSRPLPRLLRALSRAFPTAFRDRFAAELEETLATQWQDAAGAGIGARWRHMARATLDLTISAAAEHAVAVRERGWSVSHAGASMTSLPQDLAFAIRSLARRPGFVTAVVLTLALGIGANTAVFSLVDGVLLRPVPVHEPERVVSVYEALNESTPHGGMAYANYQDLAERTQTLAGLAAFTVTDVAADIDGNPEQLSAALVSGSYFPVLGIHAAVGRLLGPDDDGAPGAAPHVVLGHEFWKSRLGGDAQVVGRTVRIADNPFIVVGVAPAGFRGTELQSAPALWLPMSMHQSLSLGLLSRPDAFETRFLSLFDLVGRLHDGATAEQAEAELNLLFAHIREENPVPDDAMSASQVAQPISLLPVSHGAALADRANLLRFVRLLLGTVALTLLLACVNVANLLLVRGSERAAEFGVRVALGAARMRLVRQLLVENTVLALGGAAAGLLVALATMRLLSSFTLPGGIALHNVGLELNLRVLAFTLVLSVATSLVFGLVPAVRASRTDPASMLSASGSRATRRLPHGVLVATQVAISLVLLVGATLFLQSVRAGFSTDIGFDPAPLAAVSMEPRRTGFSDERALDLYREAATRAAQLPGVTAAAVGTHVPLARASMLPYTAGPTGTTDSDGRPMRVIAGLSSVSPGWFSTLGVPLLAGRDFTASDDADAEKVVVLNETAARHFFGSASPIGGEIVMFGSMRFRVVGIVSDTKYQSVRDSEVPFVYAALEQNPGVAGVSIVARSANPAATLPALWSTVHGADPLVPLRDARLVKRQLDLVLMPQRFGATLLTIFGLVALAITAVGIYGTVAYTVTQRTREIGIRHALGARHADILRLVLRRTGVALAAGTVVGAGVALFATRVADQFLYGVSATDPMSFGMAAMALVATALVVSLLPARRAASIDPAQVMRTE